MKTARLMVRRQVRTTAERESQRMRETLGLHFTERLNPFLLAERLGLMVLTPTTIPGLAQWVIDHLLERRPTAWSAASCLINDRVVVLLNPTHGPRRVNASLMEEIAHVWLGHAPSRISLEPSIGGAVRTCSDVTEQEAFATGAAALLPYEGLRKFVLSSSTVQTIADHFEVSVELTEYRLKVTRLWRMFAHMQERTGLLFKS